MLLLKRSPGALEGGPSERQHLLGVGREDSEWGRRTTKGVLPEDVEVQAALCSSGVRFGQRRSSCSARFEVCFPGEIFVRCLFGGGSVMVVVVEA